MNSKILVAILIALCLVGFLHALSFRYTVINKDYIVIVHDNWTGKVKICQVTPSVMKDGSYYCR